MRWLVSDVPSRFTVEAQSTDDPAQVRLVVKARDAEFKPLDNVDMSGSTIQPVRAQEPAKPSNAQLANAPVEAKTVELAADPSATEAGSYEATYVVPQAGAYAVDAVVTQPDGKVVGRAATGLTSDPAVDEFRTLKPNRALSGNPRASQENRRLRSYRDGGLAQICPQPAQPPRADYRDDE